MLKYLTMRVFITVSTYQRLTWLVVKKKTNFVMKALKQGECMPISITWQGWNRSWCQYFTADFFLCHKLHISSIVLYFSLFFLLLFSPNNVKSNVNPIKMLGNVSNISNVTRRNVITSHVSAWCVINREQYCHSFHSKTSKQLYI